MLRLLPDKYSAALYPDRLELIRRSRGLRSAVDFRHAEALVPAVNGPAWRTTVDAFQRTLATTAKGTGDLGVVLSNHFVRYLLIPWNAQIASEEEFRNYAAATFEEVYGEASVEWEVCVSAERPGSPRLAAAIDRALLAAINTAVASTRLRLTSVQPYLMAAYNRMVRPRHEKDFVFMLAEAGRVCILAAQGGKWRHVSAMAEPREPAALSALLAREIQLADLQGESVPPVLVHAAHRRGLTLPPVFGAAPLVLESQHRAGPVLMGDAARELAAAG